jgi:hypothetical protein
MWSRWWNEKWQVKPKYFVLLKSHVTRSEIDPRPQWGTDD